MSNIPTLSISDHPRHVEITLQRPAQRNAINRQMVTELHAALEGLESNPKILVLHGSGGHFAAGADLAEMVDRDREDALQGINLRLFERIRSLPLPSIAAIDGFALGGGAELTYACDLRLATTRAVIGNPEAQLGILAAAGAAYRLREIVGETLTKEMLYCGRRLSGDELLSSGLVSRLVDPDELLSTARNLVQEMSTATLLALRLTKLAIDAPAGAHPIVDLVAQAVLFEDSEKYARMRAFLNRHSHPDSTQT